MIPSRPSRGVARRIALAGWMIVLALAVPACRASARPASPDAAAVVTTLYQDHFAHEQNWARTYERQRALFAPGLAALLDADLRAAAANADEIVGLDFDPLTDAQDDMPGFAVAPATRDGGDALVAVAMGGGEGRTAVRVRLARAGAGWRVTNIHYEHGDLVSLLRRLAADRQRNR